MCVGFRFHSAADNAVPGAFPRAVCLQDIAEHTLKCASGAMAECRRGIQPSDDRYRAAGDR